MNRRDWLKRVAGVGAALSAPTEAWGAARNPPPYVGGLGDESLASYLETLRREDGGYGWAGQDRSHLTPTYYVIETYLALGRKPPGEKEAAKFVRENHPAVSKKLEQERRMFEFQQFTALRLLGENSPSELEARILGCTKPLAYLKQYERHGYPLFASEMGIILARLELKAEISEEFKEYLVSRRRENGSYSNTPASDGSDGHVMSTLWGVAAEQRLSFAKAERSSLVKWLQRCQLPSGGFTFAPNPAFGGVEDVAYTWAGVRALLSLQQGPPNFEKCAKWLASLRNSDGGFGDRPGWNSNPMATYAAVKALHALGVSLPKVVKRGPARRELPKGLNVFSIQLEAHGQGSPAEAVELARALKIHLWGAKNAKAGWLARAQAIADQRKVGTRFFVSNEEYGTWVDVPGQGTYSHTSDIVAPAGVEIGKSAAGEKALSWSEFKEKRVAPLEKGGGRLIWQFGENEELVRMFLDESLERGGFAAISTYHFGNPDFTNSEPFLHRWRGKLPFVALQDAHGAEPWWFADMTEGFRTLFLAEEASWEGWLRALKENWVVAVRRDQWTAGKTWMHAPDDVVADFVRAREENWRWWENAEIRRPIVSVVALRAGDEFEAGRPEEGGALRVRCARRNSAQGLPKEALAELVKVTVDGREVEMERVSRMRANGVLEDEYYLARLGAFGAGHRGEVTVRVLASGMAERMAFEFEG